MNGVLEAVLFDLDGTLMDHDGARTAGLAAHVGERLPNARGQELARIDGEWRRLEALHYDEYARGECSFEQQRRRRVRGLHEWLGLAAPSDADADAWFGGYLTHYRARWRAFADALPAIEALAAAHPRAALGVVTNGEGDPQRAKLATIGLAERFQVVVASGEAGVSKPERAIFTLACERLGAKPERAAHVGDRLDLDAQGAAAAGLRGIWLDRPGAVHPASASASALEEESGVVRITTLHELEDALAV
jgi:putative hydrolase of the HAD superfamily